MTFQTLKVLTLTFVRLFFNFKTRTRQSIYVRRNNRNTHVHLIIQVGVIKTGKIRSIVRFFISETQKTDATKFTVGIEEIYGWKQARLC